MSLQLLSDASWTDNSKKCAYINAHSCESKGEKQVSHGHKCGATPWIGTAVLSKWQWELSGRSVPGSCYNSMGKICSERLWEQLCVRWDFLFWKANPSPRSFTSVQWDRWAELFPQLLSPKMSMKKLFPLAKSCWLQQGVWDSRMSLP